MIGEKLLPDSFSKHLESAFDARGQLCVGIDPHDELLADNGFELTAQGLLAFGMEILEQLEGVVSIVKPQVSFFERYGSAGFAALEQLLQGANSKGFLVIADAKRGDIGSTMEAYSQAWLGRSAPFVCDALTVNPYLGVGALAPAISTASERGKGLFILSATSNTEGMKLQSSLSEVSVAAQVASEVAVFNERTALSQTRFGHLGLVIGATVDLNALGLSVLNSNKHYLRAPILSPGFGFQGAKLEDARQIFGHLSSDVIYTISRSALRDGISNVRKAVTEDQNTLKTALKA